MHGKKVLIRLVDRYRELLLEESHYLNGPRDVFFSSWACIPFDT
jgi:hypothetical protein